MLKPQFLLLSLLVPLSFTAAFGEEIEIKLGETVSYDELKLYFFDIEDSRCPSDVTCIWEGKVSALIQYSNHTHNIDSSQEIGISQTSFAPYVVTLIDVMPYPISTEKPDYVAILDIVKLVPVDISFDNQIFMLVDKHIRKAYYSGNNIISSSFNHDSSSVLFETGENSTLSVKIPKLHKHGEELFVLRNGEESIVDKQDDDCFFYATLHAEYPEKVEFLVAFWPEQHTVLPDNCEKVSTAPLKQLNFGIPVDQIMCKESLVLATKHDGSPICVKSDSISKLIERDWVMPEQNISESSRHCYLEPDVGLCKAYIEKYYFDWNSNSCKSFVWGGCGGTVPFDTLESCNAFCK